MEFTQSELRVLKNAFVASDLDGDGVINKDDLKLSSGLADERDVEDLLRALKNAAGSTNGKDEVTFEEFARGVVDFPFLLEQFKQEYESFCSAKNSSATHLDSPIGDEGDISAEDDDERETAQVVRERRESRRLRDVTNVEPSILVLENVNDDEQKQLFDRFRLKICKGLQSTLNSFSNALKTSFSNVSAPEPRLSPKYLQSNLFPDEMPETLLDGIRLVYTMLKSKCRDAKEDGCIPSQISELIEQLLAGSYDLVNLIADCNDFYEPQLTELRYRNEELASNLESMARKNEQTQANYKHVMKTLTMLEFEQLESATEKKKILTESQNLRNRLEELAKSENKAHYDLSQIQTQILSKEQEIERMQKELRRLTSMKTIQELSQSFSSNEGRKGGDHVKKMRLATPNRNSVISQSAFSESGPEITFISPLPTGRNRTNAGSMSFSQAAQTTATNTLNTKIKELQAQSDNLTIDIEAKSLALAQLDKDLGSAQAQDLIRKKCQKLQEENALLVQRLSMERNRNQNVEMSVPDVSSIKGDKTLFTELQELAAETPYKTTEEAEEEAATKEAKALEAELSRIKEELARERGQKDRDRGCCGLGIFK